MRSLNAVFGLWIALWSAAAAAQSFRDAPIDAPARVIVSGGGADGGVLSGGSREEMSVKLQAAYASGQIDGYAIYDHRYLWCNEAQLIAARRQATLRAFRRLGASDEEIDELDRRIAALPRIICNASASASEVRRAAGEVNSAAARIVRSASDRFGYLPSMTEDIAAGILRRAQIEAYENCPHELGNIGDHLWAQYPQSLAPTIVGRVGPESAPVRFNSYAAVDGCPTSAGARGGGPVGGGGSSVTQCFARANQSLVRCDNPLAQDGDSEGDSADMADEEPYQPPLTKEEADQQCRSNANCTAKVVGHGRGDANIRVAYQYKSAEGQVIAEARYWFGPNDEVLAMSAWTQTGTGVEIVSPTYYGDWSALNRGAVGHSEGFSVGLSWSNSGPTISINYNYARSETYRGKRCVDAAYFEARDLDGASPKPTPEAPKLPYAMALSTCLCDEGGELGRGLANAMGFGCVDSDRVDLFSCLGDMAGRPAGYTPKDEVCEPMERLSLPDAMRQLSDRCAQVIQCPDVKGVSANVSGETFWCSCRLNVSPAAAGEMRRDFCEAVDCPAAGAGDEPNACCGGPDSPSYFWNAPSTPLPFPPGRAPF